MIYLKYALFGFLIKLMIRSAKKVILIIALISGFFSNVAKNPDKFLKNTEKNIKSFNHKIITKSCAFYAKNPSLFGVKIKAPLRACQNYKRGLK